MPNKGLAAVEQYGFVLAGGYAFHLHQITDRISKDVDLFTDRFDADLFARAERALLDASPSGIAGYGRPFA